jgi:hypothetical protein
MKKILSAIIVVLIAGALVLSLAACALNDPYRKLERAYADVMDTAESLDNPAEADLSASNLQMSMTGEISGASRMSSEEDDGPITLLAAGTNLEKAQQILNYLQYIRTRQQELNGYKSSVKVEIATFKANVKTFRSEGFSLTAEEKELLNNYIEEIKSLNTAIKGTIGKVYNALQDVKEKYNAATIDQAIAELQGIIEQMDIRVDSAARLYDIAVEINASLSAKLNPGE